ncbi:MAG: MBL fold metallo-hydrolase, partial [Alphaproteobacteria bacterium]|nr:MBL fold metallo-hydrolase [Alphaproteobacteria bacterium]
MTPLIKPYFDADTFTLSYLVTEPDGQHCAVIDPVLDYDQASARTAQTSVKAIAADIRERDLILDWILETHAHADHLSGAPSPSP